MLEIVRHELYTQQMQLWLARKGFLGVSFVEVERPGEERAIVVPLAEKHCALAVERAYRGHSLLPRHPGVRREKGCGNSAVTENAHHSP